jgi:hypothetical protein
MSRAQGDCILQASSHAALASAEPTLIAELETLYKDIHQHLEFQPGEETAEGATPMVRDWGEGRFPKPDIILGMSRAISLRLDEKFPTVDPWNQLLFLFHSRTCWQACPEASR